jgi:signal peptidase I
MLLAVLLLASIGTPALAQLDAESSAEEIDYTTGTPWMNIDLEGNVYVNQNLIDEPYLEEKAYGEPDIDFPYQVPDDRVFVLGDNRDVSVDSRHIAVGCVTSDQIVGKIVWRVWPLTKIGPVH